MKKTAPQERGGQGSGRNAQVGAHTSERGTTEAQQRFRNRSLEFNPWKIDRIRRLESAI